MSEAGPVALFWEGFEPAAYEFLSEAELQITLRPRAEHPPVCSGCGQATLLIHDVS